MDLGIFTYLFIILNFLLFLIGIMRIILSLWLTFVWVFIFCHMKYSSFFPLIHEGLFVAFHEEALFLLGLLAGFKNNIRLMFTYEFLLILLICSKVHTFVESSEQKKIISDNIQLNIRYMMNQALLGIGNVESDVNAAQQNFKCCGVQGPEFWRILNDQFPTSCCPNNKCKEPKNNPPNKYKKGCIKAIKVPEGLYSVHYFSLIPILEVILLLVGLILILLIKQTAKNTLS